MSFYTSSTQITIFLVVISIRLIESSNPIAECTVEIVRRLFSPASTIVFGFIDPDEYASHLGVNWSCPLKINSFYFESYSQFFPERPSVVIKSNKTTNEKCSKQNIPKGDLIYFPASNLHGDEYEERKQWLLCNIIRGGQFSEDENAILKELHLKIEYKVVVGDLYSQSLGLHYDAENVYLIILRYNIGADSLMEYLDSKLYKLRKMAYSNSIFIIIILGKFEGLEIIYRLFIFLHDKVGSYEAVIIATGISEVIHIFTSERDSCGGLKNVHLNEWTNGRFVKDFYYKKQQFGNFEGCRIFIRATENPPFVTFNNGLDGIEIRLLRHITKHLGLNPIFNSIAPEGNEEIWIGAMHLFNSRLFTYLERYYTLQYQWYIPIARSYPRWSSITRVFSATVWGFTFLTSILISVAIWCIKNAQQTRARLQIGLDIWAIFLSISVRLPIWTPLRMVFLTWVIFSFVFSTIFQAFMTSYFTDLGKQHQIDTYDELLQSNVTFVFESLTEVLGHIRLTGRDGYFTFGNTMYLLLFWTQNPNVAIFAGNDLLVYTLSKICESVNAHKITDYSVGKVLKMLVRPNSPYLSRINQLTNRLVEGGIPSKIIKTITNPKGIQTQIEVKQYLKDYSPISTEHFVCIFVFLGLGYVLSLVGFLLEVIFFKVTHL
ncbi:Ionotropic receptor 768 [Blattella germanica]|nr:Ionotropic receptor 768 [Blattella germanica]